MNNSIFLQLSQVFQKLGEVHTSGEDTLLMAECLQSLRAILLSLNTITQESEE